MRLCFMCWVPVWMLLMVPPAEAVAVEFTAVVTQAGIGSIGGENVAYAEVGDVLHGVIDYDLAGLMSDLENRGYYVSASVEVPSQSDSWGLGGIIYSLEVTPTHLFVAGDDGRLMAI